MKQHSDAFCFPAIGLHVTRLTVHDFSKKCVAFIFIYSLNLKMGILKWRKYVPSTRHKLLPHWQSSHSRQMECSTKLLWKPQNSQIVWCSTHQNDAKQSPSTPLMHSCNSKINTFTGNQQNPRTCIILCINTMYLHHTICYRNINLFRLNFTCTYETDSCTWPSYIPISPAQVMKFAKRKHIKLFH